METHLAQVAADGTIRLGAAAAVEPNSEPRKARAAHGTIVKKMSRESNMPDLMKTLLHRRSIRQYTDEKVTHEQLAQIVRAGLLSPTGKNKRDWEFVIIEDRTTLDKLAEARAGGASKMLAGATAAIAVFGNAAVTDVWCEDCSIAMSNMHLMADNLGLGSCWIQGRLRMATDIITTGDYVREILGVPENYELEAILSIGIPAKRPAARTLEDTDMSKVHWGRF